MDDYDKVLDGVGVLRVKGSMEACHCPYCMKMKEEIALDNKRKEEALQRREQLGSLIDHANNEVTLTPKRLTASVQVNNEAIRFIGKDGSYPTQSVSECIKWAIWGYQLRCKHRILNEKEIEDMVKAEINK